MYQNRSSTPFNSKGELYEVSRQLNSPNKTIIKNAVKRIIERMSLGDDLAELFPDVIKSLSTNDLELKKLVYLYIIHHAHLQPEKAILVVNTFRRDAKEHVNPLIRALAIRTMGCIRIARIAEHLCEPLVDALADADPYVRKTAVICVAKLCAISPGLLHERGFVERLVLCLSDSNQMVVANAVSTLLFVVRSFPAALDRVSSSDTRRLASALAECTEWGQAAILDLLARCAGKVADPKYVLERVLPRMAHSNAAVVLSAVKAVAVLAPRLPAQSREAFMAKIRPSLITLLNGRNELQFVALKSVYSLLPLTPNLLGSDVRVLFCKYNDPPYIKAEKVALLVTICTAESLEQVLVELADYAKEVDVDFALIALDAVGQVVLKLPKSFERCVNVLRSLLALQRSHLTNQIAVVLKNVFIRQNKNSIDDAAVVISELLEDLAIFDLPASREAAVWIIGELNPSSADEALPKLEYFYENFMDSAAEMKYAILTASTKLFLKAPKEAQKTLFNTVVSEILADTSECGLDLKARASFYRNAVFTDFFAARRSITKFFVLSKPRCFLPEKTALNSIASLSSMTRPNPVTEAYAAFSPLDKTAGCKLDLTAMRRAFKENDAISFETFEKAAEKYIAAHSTLDRGGGQFNGTVELGACDGSSARGAGAALKFESAIGSFEPESFVEDEKSEGGDLLTFPQCEFEKESGERRRDDKAGEGGRAVAGKGAAELNAADDDLFALNSIFVSREKNNGAPELKRDDGIGILKI